MPRCRQAEYAQLDTKAALVCIEIHVNVASTPITLNTLRNVQAEASSSVASLNLSIQRRALGRQPRHVQEHNSNWASHGIAGFML